MKRLALIAATVALLATPALADGYRYCYRGRCYYPKTYSYPTKTYTVKQYVYQQKAYPEKKENGVVSALSSLAKEQQEYNAMLDGLAALGFSPTQLQQPNYAQPYAQPQAYAQPTVPYAAANSLLGYQQLQVEAFGVSDVNDALDRLERISSQMVSGASGIGGDISATAGIMAESVAANPRDLIQLAKMQEENRARQIAVQMLEVSRPSSQLTVNKLDPVVGTTHTAVQPAAQPPAAGVSVQLGAQSTAVEKLSGGVPAVVLANCAECHNAESPNGIDMMQPVTAEHAAAMRKKMLAGRVCTGADDWTDEIRLQVIDASRQWLRK